MAVLTDEMKEQIIRWDLGGQSSRDTAITLGIGKSTIGDFLRKETYVSWWEDRKARSQAGQTVWDGSRAPTQDNIDAMTFAQLDTENPLYLQDDDGNFGVNPKGPLGKVELATQEEADFGTTEDSKTDDFPDAFMRAFNQHNPIGDNPQRSAKAKAIMAAIGENKIKFSVWKNSKSFNAALPVTPLKDGPKVLTLDIETAPIMASVWRLFDQNVGLNMIEQDWYCLSWAAKWMHEDQVIYEDKADSWDNEDDKELLIGIHKLLDEADIIITQNGKKFDAKKLNARFILNGMKPPSSYRHIDTLQEAKRHFGFTSNKLEYMTDKLCKVYKKLKHGDFPGFELWKECLRGNTLAWQEMKDYNIHDVLSLEELYGIMQPWMKTHINMNLYYSDNKLRCKCGKTDEFTHNGYFYTNLSKYDRFQCSCGAEIRGRVNLLSAEKRESLRMNVN